MIKAVIFDLDNTLIDFMKMKRVSCDAAITAMIEAGLEIDKHEAMKLLFELYDKIGMEHPLIFQEFLTQVQGRIDYGILASGIVAYRKTQPSVVNPYPEVVPTLIKLKEKGIKLAIVSDAPPIKAWIRLVELGIKDFFDVVVTLENEEHRKPSSVPFDKALKTLGLRPEECLMVGDREEKDIAGAKALGMNTAFARYGNDRNQKTSADFELNNVSQILKIV